MATKERTDDRLSQLRRLKAAAAHPVTAPEDADVEHDPYKLIVDELTGTKVTDDEGPLLDPEVMASIPVSLVGGNNGCGDLLDAVAGGVRCASAALGWQRRAPSALNRSTSR